MFLPESIGLIKQTDHTEEDGSHVLGWVPPFAGQLTGLGVIHRGVEDGYAQVSVLTNMGQFSCFVQDTRTSYLIHIRMPHFGEESD